MTPIRYRTLHIADAEIREILASQSLGRGTLAFRIRLLVKTLPWRGTPPIGRFVWFGGEVQTPAGVVPLTAHAEDIALPPTGGQERDVFLKAQLDRDQLQLIDETRVGAGGSLRFVVNMKALVDGFEGVVPCEASLTVVLNDTAWIQVLHLASAEQRFTIEAQTHRPGQSETLASAAGEFVAARQLFDRHEWQQLLTACRRVFEHLPTMGKVQALDTGWDLSMRIANAHASIRHILHAGPHTGLGTPGPAEARLAFVLTAALLDYYNRRDLNR